ncbi:MAG: PIN domain-containing protein [Planctomycetota bacterium]|jgi:predicted nucleic acid-binding protein
MRLLLDTNALIKLCHPRQDEEAQKIREWLKTWLARAQEAGDHEVIVSAVADYEARRGYLWKLDRHPNEPKALARLDQLCELLGVHPVSEDVLRDAARFWSDAKRNGYSTAPDRDIDWDVFVAAQAKELTAVVVTSNARHISRYGVDARDWDKIPPP